MDARHRVEAAFAATPRAAFLPAGLRAHFAADQPLPIGGGQTNSQPRTVVDMLTLLEVPIGATVLDVGAGSGWTTALLADLVGEAGSVVGVELVPELATWGAANLSGFERPWARIVQSRAGVLGWPDGAPYDRILVSAMARRLPRPLVQQLAPDGVLVMPVGGRMLRVRPGRLRPRVERHGYYTFVPLLDG